MNGFHDVSFTMRLALGAVGGPERRTEVLALASGREVRNAVWARSKRRWDVGGAVTDLAGLQELLAFFEARMGRLFGFRFRDPLDHSSAVAGGAVSALDQLIGVGDGARRVFGLVKDYGGVTRTIARPVLGTVRVAVDGVEAVSGWALDEVGAVAFDAAPEAGAVVTAGFEFDCAVRFEADRMEGVVEAFGAGRVVNVGLVELNAGG